MIEARVKLGDALHKEVYENVQQEIRGAKPYQELNNKYEAWDNFNKTMLRQMFTTRDAAQDYEEATKWFKEQIASIQEMTLRIGDQLRDKIKYLKQLPERLSLYGVHKMMESKPDPGEKWEDKYAFLIDLPNEYLRVAVKVLREIRGEIIVSGKDRADVKLTSGFPNGSLRGSDTQKILELLQKKKVLDSVYVDRTARINAHRAPVEDHLQVAEKLWADRDHPPKRKKTEVSQTNRELSVSQLGMA